VIAEQVAECHQICVSARGDFGKK